MTEPSPDGYTSSDSTSFGLLNRARAHDPDAWRRLVELYGPLIYYRCRKGGLATHDLADLFQEVFAAVAAHIATFHKEGSTGSFRGWLLTITQNKIHDHFRRQQKQPLPVGGADGYQQLLQVAGPVDGSDVHLSDTEKGNLLRRALALVECEFESHTWQAFWRATIEEQQPADIARDLGISVNAVYKAKSRALRRLRQELDDRIE